MTEPRPNFIDLRTASSLPRPMKSPRLHVAGAQPPELSPLDAFALQSRLLAKQLEESMKDGHRMSRLPPLTTESPLIVQGRSDYFRSMSYDSPASAGPSPQQTLSAGSGSKPDVSIPATERPVSMHPRMSRMPPTPESSWPIPSPGSVDLSGSRQLVGILEEEGLYGARRDHSPASMSSARSSFAARFHDAISSSPKATTAVRPVSPAQPASRSRHMRKISTEVLAPPTAMFARRPSSIKSFSGDSLGHELLSTSPGFQFQRKLSGASSILSPQYPRSPSISSDASGLPRPSFNFSRPLSRCATPEMRPSSRMNTPIRQVSSDSQDPFILTDEDAHTPVSMHSEAYLDAMKDESSTSPPAGPSYIYSKFSLPRGKSLQRLASDEDATPPALAMPNGATRSSPFVGQAPPSPPTQPPSVDGSFSSLNFTNDGTDLFQPLSHTSSNLRRPSLGISRFSEDIPKRKTSFSATRDANQERPSTATVASDSASTIRPAKSVKASAHGVTTMADFSADEHVDKAIQLHEEGKLNASSYHLRYAAKHNHPTGMLLYALACRHGWGVRANPKEAVHWLRKAAELVNVEMAEDGNREQDGNPVGSAEKRTRNAQLALSIYELGVSHMNGWGIEQDKALALRCFEIAGNWGDVDALAEAGFCYAKGVGCKKDLMKSARLYRRAEAKGMSMIGNSWIHKSKYNEVDEAQSKPKTKGRSRSRSIFGYKRKESASNVPLSS